MRDGSGHSLGTTRQSGDPIIDDISTTDLVNFYLQHPLDSIHARRERYSEIVVRQSSRSLCDIRVLLRSLSVLLLGQPIRPGMCRIVSSGSSA